MIEVEKALEMAQCAQINIDNLKKMVVGENPFLNIIKMQVDEVVKLLGGEPV